ncbi:MAG: ATP phosphoribosyltransferase regulatory subunit [Hyphomonadaceae bacterium]
MSACEAIRGVLAKLAPHWLEPPVLQPAALYLELSGEDIRRRAFLVSDAEGGELCLRPDMTVPAVRAAYALAEPPGIVAYEGRVFRQQPEGSTRETEFLQIGAEWLGRVGIELEAEIVALALEACAAAKVVSPVLRLGDVGLRAGFVAACGLEASWAQRTLHALERPGGLAALATEIERPAAEGGAGLAAALAALTPEAAEAAVADMLAVADIQSVGGRPTAEIAARLRARGRLAASAPPSAAQQALLGELIAIDAADGLTAAAKLAKSPALTTPARAAAAVEAAAARAAALAKRVGKAAGAARFAPGLGRALAYYDGFVFELEAPALGERASLGGGGRYDGLARALWPADRPAAAQLAAAGFALRPARLEAAAA